MKLLPTANNYQQKQNFGMLRITGTSTPEELAEGVKIVRELTQDIYKPFKIKEAISPDYKPMGYQGGWSLSDLIDESKLPEYQAEGNVLIFDKELKEKIWKNGNIAENFDREFRNIKEISLEQLRKLASQLQTRLANVDLFQGALKQAETGVSATFTEAAKAFGEKN